MEAVVVSYFREVLVFVGTVLYHPFPRVSVKEFCQWPEVGNHFLPELVYDRMVRKLGDEALP